MRKDPSKALVRDVAATIRRYGMFEPSETVVVAVSGGPDSVALLSLLHRMNMTLCLKLHVAHLDHNVRTASASDAQFVRKLALTLGLPFHGARIDWGSRRAGHASEEDLRSRRYDFLIGLCRHLRCKKIATAHTKDDQAETVLMRLIRGSGLHGLEAIVPVRRLRGGLVVVRPLIATPREAIEVFLRSQRIASRVDETNTQERFLRNRIRHELLPLLEKSYNKNAKEALSNLALTAGADYEYLRSQAESFLRKNLKRRRSGCSVSLEALQQLDTALRRLALRLMIQSFCGNLRRLGFKHWTEMDDLLFWRPSGSKVHLPQGLVFSKTVHLLSLSKSSAGKKER